MHDAVMRLLKSHLASFEHVDLGRYQFVNLDPVREAAGALWPQLRERAFLASRTMIERRIAEDDLIIPCATGFLVIFKALSGEPARRLTERIRGELEAFFMGDEELGGLKVEGQSERLTLSEFEAALARSRPEAGPKPAGPAAPAPDPDAAGALRIDALDYLPAWDARNEAVGGFFVRARRLATDGRGWLINGAIVRGARRAEARLALDLLVLERAAAALNRLVKAGSRCALIVPAGYDSLSQPRCRSAYITRLTALGPALKPMIWVRLEDTPLDAPRAALAETGRMIAQHAGRLFVHAPADAMTLEPFTEIRPALIGTDFPTGSDAAVRTDLDRFMALVRRARAGAYLDNLENWEAVRLGVRSPARLLAGPSIGVLTAPKAPYRLTRSGLLASAA